VGVHARLSGAAFSRDPGRAVARAHGQRGDVVDEAGRRVTPGEPYTAHGKLYYYRSVPDEEPSAAPVSVLFEDELLVVADKPHFLSVTPSGHYLQQTLLVQLRRQLGLDGLTPLHRLDRETAGVVLLAKQPATCAPVPPAVLQPGHGQDL
jgi:tRNA pseudouridine32 synthase/23S rRNA pseudouridine746 synthase